MLHDKMSIIRAGTAHVFERCVDSDSVTFQKVRTCSSDRCKVNEEVKEKEEDGEERADEEENEEEPGEEEEGGQLLFLLHR